MPVQRHPIARSQRQDPLAGLPMDHALIARLRASFEQIRMQGLRLGEVFYAKLFAAAPHLRSMFKTDLATQSDKLIASLDTVVRNLERPEQNAAMLAALGERHAGYGARPEHYTLVVKLLVDSMREVLGPAADEKGLEEWRTALRLISDQMIAASAPRAGDTPAQR